MIIYLCIYTELLENIPYYILYIYIQYIYTVYHYQYYYTVYTAPYTPPSMRSFTVDAVCATTNARATTLTLGHGPTRTPVFMPVGTQGAMKGIANERLAGDPTLNHEIVLANTYHLALRPGAEHLGAVGGLHKFMGWDRNILTDSGGFQMVSLLKLAKITEEGVTFQSPVDGSPMLLTPEESMRVQNQIGSDIMMALDDVVSSVTVDDARFREATHRTLRWIDRCIAAHARPDEQCLFGILQGGLDVSPGGLRDICLQGMLERDAKLPGYAIGGLAGGEDKNHFWRVVLHACQRLPDNKPRYLMGVGYPLDLVVCSALGVDMYDCVYPTRTARFGTALVPNGTMKLRHRRYRDDMRPVDPECRCTTCRDYTRSALNHLFATGATLAGQLLTVHNLAYMMRLVRDMRAAIEADAYPAFVRAFLRQQFPPVGVGAGDDVGEGSCGCKGSNKVPVWVVDALAAVNIDLAGTGLMFAQRNEAAPSQQVPRAGAAAENESDASSSTAAQASSLCSQNKRTPSNESIKPAKKPRWENFSAKGAK